MSFGGKILTYIQVLVFLFSIFVSWFIVGWLVDYSFPFKSVKELIFSCITGNLGAKVNNLQDKLQRGKVTSQYTVQDLNKRQSEYWLAIKLIELLGNGSPESNQRIAQTLEALEFQKNLILEELEPRKPQKYKIFSTIQNAAFSLFQSKLEKDYIQLEKLLNDLIKSVRNSQPSPTALEQLIEKIEREIDKTSAKISPARLRLIYKLENLIDSVLLKNISGGQGVEAHREKLNFIKDLRLQRKILREAFEKLLVENREKQQTVNRQSEEINRLKRETASTESEINYFRQEIEELKTKLQEKQRLLDEQNKRLVESRDSEFDLKGQISTLQEQINIFEKKYEKQTFVGKDSGDALRDLLINRKSLEGPYIGNLSDTKSKYHFNANCPDWKSLVLEYLFIKNEKRTLRTSDSPDIFKEANLEECSKCSTCKPNKKKGK